jgi:hypothetical protein
LKALSDTLLKLINFEVEEWNHLKLFLTVT